MGTFLAHCFGRASQGAARGFAARWLATPALVAVAGLSVLLSSTQAEACGGFFCGQQPVDQTAERILFEVGQDSVTMTTQISFNGKAADFAWILPLSDVPALESLAVYPQKALNALDSNSGPNFTPPSDPACSYCAGCDFALGSAPPSQNTGAPASPPPVTVYIRAEVGAYDVAVVGSSSPAELVNWLRTAGYRITPAMEPYVTRYTEEGMKFLALKLLDTADVKDLKPFRFTLPGTAPSIPLRMTALAAEPEMGIVVFVLGQRRFEGKNWAEVEIADNQIRYNPFSNSFPVQTNWAQLVAQGVDRAGGQGWVTEFAGPSQSYATQVRTQVQNDNFATPEDREAARALLGSLEAYPYLTRLYTRVSAEEMTSDPLFGQSSLGNVDREHQLSRIVNGVDQCPMDPRMSTDPCDFTTCGAAGLCRPVPFNATGMTAVAGIARDPSSPIAGCACWAGATARLTFAPDGSTTVVCQDGRLSFLNPGDREDDGLDVLPDPCAGFSCGDHGQCVSMNLTPTCVCDQGYVAVGQAATDGTRQMNCVQPMQQVPAAFYASTLPALPEALPGGREVLLTEPAPMAVPGSTPVPAPNADFPMPRSNPDLGPSQVPVARASSGGGGCSLGTAGSRATTTWSWLAALGAAASLTRRRRGARRVTRLLARGLPALPRRAGPLLVALAGAGVLLTSAEAQACGGFFCGQQPVDQTAERILFEVGQDSVTMTTQISFNGKAADFAWILPLGEVPPVESLAVFPQGALNALDANSGPQFQLPQDSACYQFFPPPPPQAASAGPGAGGPPPVTVYVRAEVGPYDAVVVGSSDPAELVSWLRNEGYRITPAMEPYVARYTEERMKFLALKLQDTADVKDLQPFRFSLPGTAPSIPLRMTALAAEPEMSIVVFVLGQRRFEGKNWANVEIADDQILFNPLTTSFGNATTNWAQLVAQGVDRANGQGWVTEFAGPSESYAAQVRAQVQNDNFRTEGDRAAARALLASLEAYPYLTRLYTRVSAEEMTSDPIFGQSSQADVDRLHQLSRFVNGEDQCMLDRRTSTDPCDFTTCGAAGLCRPVTDNPLAPASDSGCACWAGATARLTLAPDGSTTVICQDGRLSFLNPGDREAEGLEVLPDPCAGFSCGSNGQCVSMNLTPTCVCDQGYVAVGQIAGDGTRRMNCVEPMLQVPAAFYASTLPVLPEALPGGREVLLTEPVPMPAPGSTPSPAPNADFPMPRANPDLGPSQVPVARAPSVGGGSSGGGCSVATAGPGSTVWSWLAALAAAASLIRRRRRARRVTGLLARGLPAVALRTGPLLVALAGASVLLASPEARACGGFFCGRQPVDQTAERILFEVGQDGVTMTTQISFNGKAADFAWILPLGEVPALDSLAVFPQKALNALDSNSGPNFQPPNDPACYSRGPGCPNCGGLLLPTAAPVDEDAAPPPVTVYIRAEVGPYDAAVVGSQDPAELVRWLREAGYRITPAMEPYVARYTEEGMKFLALKLRDTADVKDLAPFRFRLPGTAPSIPLRMTALAAEPEMSIVVFVLGERRFEGKNWASVEIADDQIRYNPFSFSFPVQTNWAQLVAKGVDRAGGQGWVTEFAGSSASYAEQVRNQVQNGNFATDEDREAARALLGSLEAYPYLTRLYTRVSAEEMTSDPVFGQSSLGDVDSAHQLSRVVNGVDQCAMDSQGSTDPCDFTTCGAPGLCRPVAGNTTGMQPTSGTEPTSAPVPGCACWAGATARLTFAPDGSTTVICQDGRLSFLNPGDREAEGLDVLPDPCAGFSCGDNGQCISMNLTPTCVCDQGFVAVGQLGSDGARQMRCVAPMQQVPAAFYASSLPALPEGLPGGREVVLSEPEPMPMPGMMPQQVENAGFPMPRSNPELGPSQVPVSKPQSGGGGCSLGAAASSGSEWGWLLALAAAGARRRQRHRTSEP